LVEWERHRIDPHRADTVPWTVAVASGVEARTGSAPSRGVAPRKHASSVARRGQTRPAGLRKRAEGVWIGSPAWVRDGCGVAAGGSKSGASARKSTTLATEQMKRWPLPGRDCNVSSIMGESTKPDVFPLTQGTWIEHRLALGDAGRRDLNNHIMSVYLWPLTVYFRGTRDRYLGDPEEVVQGFFASRLSKCDYFRDWKASGKRLRHWLINGFCFYLKELHRERRRNMRDSGVESPEPVYEEAQAVREIDQAFLRGIVRRAMLDAAELCEQQGLAEHFKIFEEHFYLDQPYEVIGPRHGVDSTRAAVMARTAKRKFQSSLRELFMRDGAEESRVEDEISALLRIAGVQVQRKQRESREQAQRPGAGETT
jgi:hypothetical protein